LKYPWLVETLVAKSVDATRGILAQLNHIPEQEGELYCGLWLTSSGSFYAFEILVPRTYAGELKIERWVDVSSETSTNRHTPGTGVAFGAIALEVLHELSV